MKRIFFIFSCICMVSILPAQTIESVMRALQERHMAVEKRNFAAKKTSKFFMPQDIILSHDPYQPTPIDWGNGLPSYPAEGSINTWNAEQRLVLVRLIQERYNAIASAYIFIGNSPGADADAAPVVSYRMPKQEVLIGGQDIADGIKEVGARVNELKYMLWPFQVDSGVGYIEPSFIASGTNLNQGVSHYSGGGNYWSGWDTDNRGYSFRRQIHKNVRDTYFVPDVRLDGWMRSEDDEEAYTSDERYHAGFVVFRGNDSNIDISGELAFWGRQFPNPHLAGTVSLSEGNWPSGYQEFKGYRKWLTLEGTEERVNSGVIGYPGGVPSDISFATGAVLGSYAAVQWNDGRFSFSGREPLSYAYGGDTHLATELIYYNTSGILVFKPTFQHHVVYSRTPAGNATVDVRADMARQMIYVELGRGLDGRSPLAIGVSRLSKKSMNVPGFASVMDLAVFANPSEFEIYYESSSLGIPNWGPEMYKRMFWGMTFVSDNYHWDDGLNFGSGSFQFDHDYIYDFRYDNVLHYPDGGYRHAGRFNHVMDWYRNPLIKQVVGLDVIAQVVPSFSSDVINPHKYSIELYRASQKGAFSNGKYSLSGVPFEVVEFDDRWKVDGPSELIVHSGAKEISIGYKMVEREMEWVDLEYGLRIERFQNPVTGEVLKTYVIDGFNSFSIKPAAGGGALEEEDWDVESNVYTVRRDGGVIAEHGYLSSSFLTAAPYAPYGNDFPDSLPVGMPAVLAPSSTAAIHFEYAQLPSRPVKSRTGPGWFWQDFDDYGRVTKRIDQLGSNPFPASAAPWPDAGGNMTTENTYSGNTLTSVTKRAGTVIGISWRVWNGPTEVADYIATSLSAADYSDSSNLRTTTRYYGGGESTGGAEPWAIKSIVYPDQTASLYSYTYDTATKQRTVTVSTGQPNAPNAPTSIVSGTQIINTTNQEGYVISAIKKSIPSNVVLSSAIVPSGQIDVFGRPTRIDYLDGTHITRTYYPDFRGLVQSETDSNGITSTYTYDVLNRLTQVVRDGVTTTISNNGLTTTSTSASSSGSRATSSTVNLFGELQSAFNTFEPATTTSVIHDAGKFMYTTTETASGRTVIETKYEDGSLESIRGTGAEHYRYEYGIEIFTGSAPYALSNVVVYTGKSLSFTKQIQLTDAGGDSGSYVKTYTDGAGRIVVEETASGTGTGAAYRFSYYNDKGQLWALMDPDGIVTLFGYDERGARTTVATDVNKNGIIDAVAGQEDEVVTTTTTYTSGQAITITQVGHGENAREVSRSITTIASGATTVTRNGNSNLATTITPDIANKKVTVSGADGSAVYEYDNNGQPDAYTVKHASGETLKTTSYNHDKFGRLTATTGTAADATFSTTFNPDGTLATATTTASGLTAQSLSVAYSNPGGNRRVELTNNGKTQAVEFSAKGELIERSGFGTFDMELTHDLGPDGTTTTLTTPTSGATTTFSLNAAGVTTGKTFTEANPGPSMNYSTGGLPTSITTPAGANATYGYGSNGVERGLVKTITYPVNTNTANVALEYDEEGRVKSITDASGTRTITYDKGQLDTETYIAGPLSGLVIDRSLDTRERRSGLTLANGAEMLYGVSYGYHGGTSALENVTKGNWSSHYTYEASTRLIEDIVQKRGGTTVLTTARDYDAYKRLHAITSAAGPSGTTSYTYHYNTIGQRDTITRENGDYWSIGYQGDGQLGTAVKKNSANEAYPGYNYAYNFTGIGTRSKIAINDTVSMDREADYESNELNQVEEREVPGFVDVLGSIAPLADVTVDVRNQASPVAKKGVWAASVAGGGFNGTNYLFDNNDEKGRKWVDYSLSVTPGTYSVEMIWSASPANSAAVPVIIHAGDVRKTQVVNQQANGGTWVSVGTYTMATGGRLSVRIANMGTTGQVIADAVRIKRTTDTWVQVLDSEDADVVTTLTAAKLGDIFHLAIPVDNSAGPVAAKFDIVGMLAGAGENGTDAVASFETSAIIPPAVALLDHDLDGRRNDDWKWTYTWNAAGQLRSVESTTAYTAVGEPHLKLVFDYDAQGRRFSKKIYRDGATTPSEALYFIYDGWNLIAELNENLSVVRSYTWGHDISQTYQGAGGIGGLLSIHVGTTETYFPVYDGSGNITSLIDATTGSTVAVYEYAPFGEPVRVSGPAAKVSPFGFSTKYTDKETGFCYYGHRYYDPELGHWISREPLGEMESANLYAFCGNDPVNQFDYLGLNAVPQYKMYIDANPWLTEEQKFAIQRLAEAAAYHGVSFNEILAEAERALTVPLPPPILPRHEFRAAPSQGRGMETGTERDAVAGAVASVPKFGYDLSLALIYSGNFLNSQLTGRPDFNMYAASRVSSVYVYPWIDYNVAYGFGANSGSRRFEQGRVVTESSLQLMTIIVPSVRAVAMRRSTFTQTPLPHGFKDISMFDNFALSLNRGLRSAGLGDAKAIFQGSAVTGTSYRTGHPFDFRRVSDFDIALVSPSLLSRAKALGIPVRSGGARSAPLKPEHLHQLGLSELAAQLSKQAGRPVNFMIYGTAEAAVLRSPSIFLP